MGTVLILGNGISRLAFDEQIRGFHGEIWGCNRIYLDYGDVITGLSGHTDVMQESSDYRTEHDQKWRVMGSEEDPYTCRELFRKDTGTTLVAEALTRGHDVIVCGFDIGGLDVYSPAHEKKNKTSWVERWRLILSEFGSDRVTFWGHDHKPFLLSSRPASEYSRKYLRGQPHIEGDGYDEAARNWKGDYSRIWDAIPCVIFRNVGTRDYTFSEIPGAFRNGDEARIPESLARKYADFYPGQFEIKPLPD